MSPPRAASAASTTGDFASRRQTRPAWETVRELLPYVWPSDRTDLKVRVALALAAVLAGKLLIVSAPFFYKNAVDGLTGEGAAAAAIVVPVMLIVGYGVARILGLAMAQARYAIFAKVNDAMSRRLGLKVFRHLHSLSLRFHLERRTGGLGRTVNRGVGYAAFLLDISLFNILPTVIELVLVAGVMIAVFGPAYAGVTAATVVAYVLFTFFITEWRKHLRRELNDRDADVNSRSVDTLLNFETVKYFNNEEHEARSYDTAWAAYERASVKSTVTLAFLNAGQVAIFSLGLIALLLLAGFEVAAGTMTVGEFVMVNTLLIQLAAPLDSVGTVYRLIREALIDTERLLELLQTKPEITDRPGAVDLTVPHGEIRFEAVDFGYTPERQILFGVDFTIPPGKTVAVVGPTGAGKSTLSRLLYRFYEPQAGRITIDGQDITQVTQDSLRNHIGMVPQDTVLFNETIGYNIVYGRPGATREEIEAVARQAQIHDFVTSLPDGYETTVGERGLKLSGGEKQRVAIARTLLKGPPILILDEATSALDSHTEREIQSALTEVAKGRSTLVIAHRLSTIRDAHMILVVDGGRIVERGTHDALLKADGLYASMWARQKDLAAAENVLAAETV